MTNQKQDEWAAALCTSFCKHKKNYLQVANAVDNFVWALSEAPAAISSFCALKGTFYYVTPKGLINLKTEAEVSNLYNTVMTDDYIHDVKRCFTFFHLLEDSLRKKFEEANAEAIAAAAAEKSRRARRRPKSQYIVVDSKSSKAIGPFNDWNDALACGDQVCVCMSIEVTR